MDPTINKDGFLLWRARATGTDEIDETITFDRPVMITEISILGPTTSVWSSTYKSDPSTYTGQQLGDIALDNATATLYSNERFHMMTDETLNIASSGGVSGVKELTIKGLDLNHHRNHGAC